MPKFEPYGTHAPLKRLIVMVGPTAVGKTRLALMLAQRLGTEIISADSRQVYKEMNVGTAKPLPEELSLVQHHFVDSHSIQNPLDAARYGQEALVLIHRLFEKYDSLILCGGSGLYVRAVCEGLDDIPPVPTEIRDEVMGGYAQGGLDYLVEKMKALDPGYLVQLDSKNPRRLMRALEVFLATGASLSSFHQRKKYSHAFETVKIGLETDRQELYGRIGQRMDEMVARGLFEEGQDLFPFRDLKALQTVGYQEVFGYLEGRYDRDEALRLLNRNTRHYAKRQMTWFKKDPEVTWFHPMDEQGIFAWAIRKINEA